MVFFVATFVCAFFDPVFAFVGADAFRETGLRTLFFEAALAAAPCFGAFFPFAACILANLFTVCTAFFAGIFFVAFFTTAETFRFPTEGFRLAIVPFDLAPKKPRFFGTVFDFEVFLERLVVLVRGLRESVGLLTFFLRSS